MGRPTDGPAAAGVGPEARDGLPGVPELIARKRDGGELKPVELRALVEGFLAGEVEDAQMAALLMAGVLRGFTTAEAVALTSLLLESGATLDLSALPGPTVDKHSTGGVGDTTTLVVAPLLAAAGCQVAKLAGRGLGHTGGTLDKLESIPGLSVDLGPERLRAQVAEVGLAVAAATEELVPADKRLYALRDVTATVPSPALLASSIMSKKLAGGATNVLLDVKVGDGAFLTDVEEGVALAELCATIGETHGRRTGALVTDMSQPLGEAVGNALEVAVAVETLRGERHGRLRDLSVALTAACLELTGVAGDEARQLVVALLDGGAGLERLGALVAAQGGDTRVIDQPRVVLPAAPVVRQVTASAAGVVEAVACRAVGELAVGLGAGRHRRDEVVDPSVGVELLVRVGDRVEEQQLIGRVHARDGAAATDAARQLAALVTVGEPVEAPPLVHARIGLAGRVQA